MPNIRITQGKRSICAAFDAASRLGEVLSANGFEYQRPCGGRGACGKCAVAVSGAVSPPTESERRFGRRLACQITLLGDCEVTLPESEPLRQIEQRTHTPPHDQLAEPMPGRYGAAVDIGTTTLAARLIELDSGRCIGSAGISNPQTAIAADVMSRIGIAIAGKADLLRRQVTDALQALLSRICLGAGVDEDDVESLVITGNTTMLHLLAGISVEPLSHAPFTPPTLFGETRSVLGRVAYFPPCVGAFVGADIICAVLDTCLCSGRETSALMDVGTNGEMALWHGERLFLCSAAAGPVFEGAGISCGCASVSGAIDRAWTEGGVLGVHTIDNAPAVGVCGSGLVDAVAAMRTLGWIDKSGAVDRASLPLTNGIALYPEDVRGVQMAKAAIAAGLDVLLYAAGTSAREVSVLHLAGGFGSHLHPQSAAAIGLIPRVLAGKTRAAGNAALSGASTLLLNMRRWETAEELTKNAIVVSLGGNALFEQQFIAHLNL